MESREKTLRKTENDLTEISSKLNTRNLKTQKEILERVNNILSDRGVQGFFHISLSEVREKYVKQVGAGRPGSKTKFKTVVEKIYSLSYARNRTALKEEKKVDGIFPLLSTDTKLTAKEALIAYKYQPRLEKRFTHLKSVLNAAPLLFKKIVRVEAIMFLFFMALMLQAILERAVRYTMKNKNILALPIYPEHRIAYYPTTAKIFDRFDGLSVYYLKQSRKGTFYKDELSKIQKGVLEILGISEMEFWSENSA
jgi:transposase